MANKLYKPLLIDSVLASADLPKQRFVSFGGAVSGAGEKAYGICDVETESGQYAPIATTGSPKYSEGIITSVSLPL